MKLLPALVALSLLVACSRSTNTGAGHGFQTSSQEALDLRLEAVVRYESWLKAQGFSSSSHRESQTTTDNVNGTVRWTSIRYLGQLPELGDVEVLIEKRDRVLTDSADDESSDIHIHLRANVSQTPQAKEAWQHLDDEVKTLLNEGIYKAGKKVAPLPKK